MKKENFKIKDILNWRWNKAKKIDIIKILISHIVTSKKEYKVIYIRDIMAASKYKLIEKYPDYSYMKNGKDKYETLNNYIKETIK